MSLALGLIPPLYAGEGLNQLIKSPLPWQTSLQNILLSDPHPRDIIWVFDPVGGAGKSTFAKYYVWKELDQIMSWDSQRDLFHARRMGKDKRIVFFEFTRSIPKYVDQQQIYSTLETLKNGLMFSGKYESGDLVTAKPHIVVFSNSLPKNPSLLSQDLWVVYRIGSRSQTLIHMSANDCNKYIQHYHYWQCEQWAQRNPKQFRSTFKSDVDIVYARPPKDLTFFYESWFLTEDDKPSKETYNPLDVIYTFNLPD